MAPLPCWTCVCYGGVSRATALRRVAVTTPGPTQPISSFFFVSTPPLLLPGHYIFNSSYLAVPFRLLLVSFPASAILFYNFFWLYSLLSLFFMSSSLCSSLMSSANPASVINIDDTPHFHRLSTLFSAPYFSLSIPLFFSPFFLRCRDISIFWLPSGCSRSLWAGRW
jgi:hypothetical protein